MMEMSEHEQAGRGLQLSLFGNTGIHSDEASRTLISTVSVLEEAASQLCMEPGSRPWTARELEAWLPPGNALVSDFAAQDRYLPSESAYPGKWEHRAFYPIEPMDSFVDPIMQELTLMAAAQSIKSEITYNIFGHMIKNEPAPALVVMPTSKSTKAVFERIKNMIMLSPALAAHLTGKEDDVSIQSGIKLDNMIIRLATAGSDAELRNFQARVILFDEQDGYPKSTEKGKQGSPIGQGKARAITFWNKKFLNSCTPTVESGNINISFKKSDRRRRWMPCPHCFGYQIVTFWQLKHVGCKLGEWPKDKRGEDYIIENSVARYECVHCGREIEERFKPWMDEMGTWVPDCSRSERSSECDDCLQRENKPQESFGSYCPKITLNGTVAFPRPRSRHRGYHWSAMISPFVTWEEMAAEFFKTKGDPELYKDFVQLYLGEIWKEVIKTTSESEILKAKCDLAPQTVPTSAIALTCFIDCQKYGFWFVVRAWARDYSSWLVHYGYLSTWEDVEKLLFNSAYPIADSEKTMRIWRAGLDTGGGKNRDGQEYDISMTERAYVWLRKNMIGRGCRVYGTKGSSHPLDRKVQLSKPLDKLPSGKPLPPVPGVGGLQIVLLDTDKLKDTFHYRLQLAINHEPGGAYLHKDTDNLYVSHILAEEKRKDRNGAEEWVKVKPRNDLFDCECGNLALADPEWPGGGINILSAFLDSMSESGEQSSQHRQQKKERSSRW